jgi:hypothetical protein
MWHCSKNHSVEAVFGFCDEQNKLPNTCLYTVPLIDGFIYNVKYVNEEGKQSSFMNLYMR